MWVISKNALLREGSQIQRPTLRDSILCNTGARKPAGGRQGLGYREAGSGGQPRRDRVSFRGWNVGELDRGAGCPML